jgi:crotonobetainyl-CoA:carnitine CoA-transferase CaiB-like acyl-CoA transferase
MGGIMKPLEGILIVNLAVNLPGPAAARRLWQLGASVVKVEPPAGDPMELYHAEW